jgi:hypothetical protein
METELKPTMTEQRKRALAEEFGLAWPSVVSPVEFAIMDGNSILRENLKTLSRSGRMK